MSSPRVRVLHGFDELRAALAGRGLDPQHGQADADVFLTLPWFENLVANGLAADAGACQLVLVEDDDAAVCLPLLARPGGPVTALANYYSSLYGPLVWRQSADGTPPAPVQLQTLLDAACRHLRTQLRPATLTLAPLDPQAPWFDPLAGALRRAGYWVDRYFCFGNWHLEAAGQSHADYRAQRPATLRHTLERGQRRLDRNGPWRIAIYPTSQPQLQMAVAAFVSVYAQSWKQPEPATDFMPGLARMAAGQGWLRLGVLSLSDTPVAAQLWLVKDGKASIYKLAYVQGRERLSVGSLLTDAMMAHALDVDRVREVDYLTGDDAYKRDWTPSRRERWGLAAFDPRTAQGLWQAFRHNAAKLKRRVAKLATESKSV